ncbi:MAG: FAD-dependent oxidoreductase [Candidatus Lokiarchaeota archaeon]|nr:FAD-dependent oxidoreductase [Candidatus Lokiarchaeota archaeon]
MRRIHEPARELAVAGEFDVVVVGGGPAGITAAIASARNEAKTLLIEKLGFLGGTATASLMNNINGFRNQVKPDATQTVKGIAQEIILALKETGGLGKSPYKQEEHATVKDDLSYSYCIDPEKFKFVVLEMAMESGVEVLFHTYFSAPVMAGNAIEGVIVENKSGRSAILGKIVVDATGDGDVAARAGAPFWEAKHEDKKLVDGLMYKISGLKDAPFESCRYGDSSVVWGPAMVWGHNDAWEISHSEVATRLEVYDHFKSLLGANPALAAAGAYVGETPAMLGIRQTRFIEGVYKLTADDAITGRRFDDAVAISSAPIIHYYGYRRFLEHEGYFIPYRCLVPKKVENLLVSGRCISSEQQPYESHRSMAPIMAIGQAAGTAAALCARDGVAPRDLDVKLLRETMEAQGQVVELPR